MQNIVLSPISTDTLIERIAERTAELLNNKNVSQPEVKDLLTTKEVCELLQVNSSTIWRWQKSGKLIPYGIGGRTYYKLSEVQEAIKPLK